MCSPKPDLEVIALTLTPMMRQYYAIKEQYPDSILFFRLGDFYEMFGEDAKLASRILEIALTSREAGPEGRIPMCGVPYHAVDGYLEKMVRSGYKVAICEQLEDPSQAKGVVKRDVIRVVTPGTFVKVIWRGERTSTWPRCRRLESLGAWLPWTCPRASS